MRADSLYDALFFSAVVAMLELSLGEAPARKLDLTDYACV